MAHSFMADAFITRELFGTRTRFESRELEKGIYELEQLFVLFEWTEANNVWGSDNPASQFVQAVAASRRGLTHVLWLSIPWYGVLYGLVLLCIRGKNSL